MKGPTLDEARLLKLIAISGGMIATHRDMQTSYSTATGITIDQAMAKRLIRRGWLLGDRGDSMFGCAAQHYRVLRP
jgi:hypothetical protein